MRDGMVVIPGQEQQEERYAPHLEHQAHQAMRKESKGDENVAEVHVHEDHTKETKTPGFSRMRTEWKADDHAQVSGLKALVDTRIVNLFPDVFELMNNLWDVVREPVRDPDTGFPLKYIHGFNVWARNENGGFIEDFSRLGIREREDFLFRITTNIFEWKQRQADMWGDAMFSKAMWEEAFSRGFTEPVGRLTVDDRTNRARVHATDERYFSILQSLLSRRADAVVSGVELLGQRLKDVLTM
jgi:hypothetical protein